MKGLAEFMGVVAVLTLATFYGWTRGLKTGYTRGKREADVETYVKGLNHGRHYAKKEYEGDL